MENRKRKKISNNTSHSKTKTNRKYKDSVFQLLFDEKQSIAELYAALENKEIPPIEDVSIVTLKEALFNKMMNDLAFSIGDEYIILAEAQSTKAENMPMRMFLYLAREYERVLDLSKLHERKLYTVPTPHFYVLYNGIEPMPEVTELRLSDAYAIEEETPMIEMNIKVININAGNNKELLSKSTELNGYSIFIDKIRREIKIGKSRDKAIEVAIKECVKENVLKDFLEKHGAEVANKMFTEFTYDDMLRIRVNEATEDGMAQGIAQGIADGMKKGLADGMARKAEETARNLKKAGIDIKIIAECTGLPLEEVEQL